MWRDVSYKMQECGINNLSQTSSLPYIYAIRSTVTLQSSVYVSEHVSKHAPDISPNAFLRIFPARKSRVINNINGPFKRDNASSIIEEESE